MDDITGLRERYLSAIDAAPDEAGLEAVRLAALGRKGEVSGLMRGLGAMTPEERQTAGPALNALKDDLTAALTDARTRLADAALDARVASEWADVTLPARPRGAGDDPSREPGDGRDLGDLRRPSASRSPRGRRSRATG